MTFCFPEVLIILNGGKKEQISTSQAGYPVGNTVLAMSHRALYCSISHFKAAQASDD